jgi:hypothetical protein
MFVSGFTFVRNAVKLDYPVKEAVLSILPLCDEVVVAVGNSDDHTRELIEEIGDHRIRIIETVWDDTLRKGGKVLALETDKAFQAINPKADWAFYIQADECLHEKYLPDLSHSMEQWKDNHQVEGLLFDYRHFYGSYDFIADSRTWYRKEIRVLRNNPEIHSYRDAQGFRIGNRKLKVKQCGAKMFHYGWVRHPKFMQAKSIEASKLWHDDQWVQERFDPEKEFDYSIIDSLTHFDETHPKVMLERISRRNWQFYYDPSKKKFGLKPRILNWLERKTGYRVGEYQNYKLI